MLSLIRIDTRKTGEQLKNKTIEAGLTVQELQDRLGLAAPNAIYRWYRGEALPTLDHFVILTEIFQTRLDDLIVLTHEKQR